MSILMASFLKYFYVLAYCLIQFTSYRLNQNKNLKPNCHHEKEDAATMLE